MIIASCWEGGMSDTSCDESQFIFIFVWNIWRGSIWKQQRHY